MSEQEAKKRKNAKQAEELAAPPAEEIVSGAAEPAGETEQLMQRFLRLQADFDNFRKRSRKEREDIVKLANSTLIQGLLPVLDNFELALKALPESSGREGIQLIQRQMLEALAIAGLTPIEAVGEDFDPRFHEAILQSEAGPEQKGKVLDEAQKGYMLGDKLLRAARVHVGS